MYVSAQQPLEFTLNIVDLMGQKLELVSDEDLIDLTYNCGDMVVESRPAPVADRFTTWKIGNVTVRPGRRPVQFLHCGRLQLGR